MVTETRDVPAALGPLSVSSVLSSFPKPCRCTQKCKETQERLLHLPGACVLCARLHGQSWRNRGRRDLQTFGTPH